MTHTTHGYGSHKHNALSQEAPGDLTTTEDNGEHRQVTHTTHGYGSQKHNALSQGAPEKEEKAQSLAQPTANPTAQSLATEQSLAEKVEDRMYDTSEVDNFNE